MARLDVPARLFVASMICAFVASPGLPSWARLAGALPLVLYLPGRCLLAAVLPGTRTSGETHALAGALSLALVVLLGLGLDRVHLLDQATWPKALALWCTVACLIGAIGAVVRSGPPEARPASVPRPLGHVVGLVVAAGLAGLATQLASQGAIAQRQDVFTDLWMVPEAARLPAYATVGVRNQEGRATDYAIEILGRGHLLQRIPRFSLRAGEERTLRVALPAVEWADPTAQPAPGHSDVAQASVTPEARRREAAALRVEARLYKDGDRNSVYRRVWTALPRPVPARSDVTALGDAAPEAAIQAVERPDNPTATPVLARSMLPTASVDIGTPQGAFDASSKPEASWPVETGQDAALRAAGDEAPARDLRAKPSDLPPSLRESAADPQASETDAPALPSQE